jgi:7-carboxy-7-deazaguanine synthase (Cx14CxxC type)
VTYAVKGIHYTIQGEGARTGRPAVLLRFAGCNLWSGREEDRDKAICRFCDTDFVGTDGPRGGSYESAGALATAVEAVWPAGVRQHRYAFCTGGEPLLQLNRPLIDRLHGRGFEVAVETNGTMKVPVGVDWICVSPKAGAPLEQTSGDELKVVFPQEGLRPEDFEHHAFGYYFLQPMDGPDLNRNTQLALRYCLANPKWRFSLQTHKVLQIT